MKEVSFIVMVGVYRFITVDGFYTGRVLCREDHESFDCKYSQLLRVWKFRVSNKVNDFKLIPSKNEANHSRLCECICIIEMNENGIFLAEGKDYGVVCLLDVSEFIVTLHTHSLLCLLFTIFAVFRSR